MPQGYSRDQRRDEDNNGHARDRDFYDRRLRQDDNERGRMNMNQYSRDDDMDRGSYGRESDWDQRNNRSRDYGGRYGRNQEDYQGSRMGGYGRGQSWGGGYNEGGYDQGGTQGYRDRNDWSSGQDRSYGAGQYGGGPRTRYGANRDYPYSGMGSGSSYGQGYGGYGDYDQLSRDRGGNDYQRRLNQQDRHQDDPHYMSWRDEQVRKLDDDYDAWRQEKQTKFNSDFDSWRTKRTAPDSKSSESKSSDPKQTTKQ